MRRSLAGRCADLRVTPGRWSPIRGWAVRRAALGSAAGVVRQISEGGYDRKFDATELLDLVTAYEERIAGRPGAS